MTTETTARPTVRLYNGDCLEVLKTLDAESIDAIVTDPPYGMKYQRGDSNRTGACTTFKKKSKPIEGDDKPFDPSPWLSFPLVALTGPQWFYDKLPSGGSWHCWNKRGDYKPLTQADADFVWLSSRINSRVLSLAWRGICRHAENRDKFEHPTQKPVVFMSWIFDLLKIKPGMTVLDPYMGSGTTGVACIKAGINFVGVEIDPAYFATAQRRIAEANDTLF